MSEAVYDTTEGEFVDFATLDEWATIGKSKDARIEELEAKLAKAELIVRIIASDKWNERLGEVVDLSCEYLAELTGGKDE